MKREFLFTFCKESYPGPFDPYDLKNNLCFEIFCPILGIVLYDMLTVFLICFKNSLERSAVMPSRVQYDNV